MVFRCLITQSETGKPALEKNPIAPQALKHSGDRATGTARRRTSEQPTPRGLERGGVVIPSLPFNHFFQL
jgi:hypothetical protein